MDLTKAIAALEGFAGDNLARTLSRIEISLQGVNIETCTPILSQHQARHDVLAAAGFVKRLAGQVNVAVHALGILLCLPRLLQPGEVIDYLSLGAGNTGRAFDLETNLRVAEFKFIHWQGGPEAIRQNALFKDFYLLAEYKPGKTKYLYVLGTEYPLKFFNSRRSLESILSRNVVLRNTFSAKYPHFKMVRDYYLFRRDAVHIEDVSSLLPGLVGDITEPEELD